jgi:hypothetical protein
MAQSWWNLVIAGAGVLGIGYLGWALTRAIWTGRPPRRIPLSASVLVALATAHILSGQRSGPAPTLVAAAATIEPTCVVSHAAPTSPRRHGDLVTLTGTDQLRSDCSLWAIISDPRTGQRWAQGPAAVGPDGWSLTLVVGTGHSGLRLPYHVDLAAFDPAAHAHLQEATSSIFPLTASTPQGETLHRSLPLGV